VFTALDQIYNDKHGFEIPRSILLNTDDKQIAVSDEVTSVLHPPLQAFSLPNCCCLTCLGIATEEWQIDTLRAAEKAKAIRALFDEVVAAQPPPTSAPKQRSTQATSTTCT
jgi:hypothetical protein